MKPDPWAAALHLAAARFGLPPREVWALSLKEWRALTAAPPGAAPLSRAELDDLLHLYPDDQP